MVVENRVLQNVVFPANSQSNMDFFLPRREGRYLIQIRLLHTRQSLVVVCKEGRGVPASMTVKAAPRLATILCLEERKVVSLPPETQTRLEAGEKGPATAGARERVTSGLADWQCQQRALQTALFVVTMQGRGDGDKKRTDKMRREEGVW
jgi:hypothetical protein